MQDTESRPQVAAIVSALVQAMEAGQEAYLKNRVSVVPHCFRVFLQDEAYEALKVHFPRLRMVAEKELNERLQTLRKKGAGAWWQAAWQGVQVYLLQKPPALQDVSALGKWEFEFLRAMDASLPLNYLEIEAGFSSIGKPSLDSHKALGGGLTKHYSFLVGMQEAQVTAPFAPQNAPAHKEAAFRPENPAHLQTAVLAWMEPETQRPQSYVMNTPYLALGREGAADADYRYQPILRLTNVPIEISRVHGYLRFDAEKQVFQYQNVGTHGTDIQPPAIQSEGDLWQTLAPSCKLCLGGKLFITFKRS